MTQLPNDLMTTFLELCDPFRQAISSVPSDEDWNSISQLSKLHGVTPFFYYRAKALGLSLPPQLMKEWRQNYLLQIVREFKALRQIKEIKKILASEEIPMILLKGTSAMLRLYPNPGLRTFCDLDILLPEEKVSRFKQVMVSAGYNPLYTRNSPEDEELRKFDNHLDPLQKEERLMIEPHLSILMGRGEYSMVLPEIWRDREETKADGILVDHLSKEHFIIHSLLHCARDLSDEGFIEIKGLIDVLYASKKWKFDWLKLKDIAEKWGVEKDIFSSIAILNHYWKTEIPSAEEVAPLDISTLVLGVKHREKNYYANLPTSYINRLFKIRELPNTSSRIHYFFHLFFPTRENLRWRYNLSSKKTTLPYYFIHFLLIWKKFLTGLYYQLLYHAQ
jgi:hypothetical protein